MVRDYTGILVLQREHFKTVQSLYANLLRFVNSEYVPLEKRWNAWVHSHTRLIMSPTPIGLETIRSLHTKTKEHLTKHLPPGDYDIKDVWITLRTFAYENGYPHTKNLLDWQDLALLLQASKIKVGP